MVRFIEVDPKTGGMKARVGECARPQRQCPLTCLSGSMGTKKLRAPKYMSSVLMRKDGTCLVGTSLNQILIFAGTQVSYLTLGISIYLSIQCGTRRCSCVAAVSALSV